MSVMSDKLKETLGIIESSNTKIDEIQDEGEFVDEHGEVHQTRSEIVPFVSKQVATTIPESENSDLRDDYITSRNLTHTLIDMTGSALAGALEVAVESQHPKAYTVFNELANTMRLLSKDLIEMQEIYKNITKEKEAKAQIVHATQNNTIIQPATNASLSDILKALGNDSGTMMDIDMDESNE